MPRRRPIFFFLPRAPCSLGVSEDPSRPFLPCSVSRRVSLGFLLCFLVCLPLSLFSLSLPLSLRRTPPRRFLVPLSRGQRSCVVASLSKLDLFAAIHVRGDGCEFAHNSTSPCPSLAPPTLVVSSPPSLLSRHSVQEGLTQRHNTRPGAKFKKGGRGEEGEPRPIFGVRETV